MRHPPDRLENSLSITEACSTSRYFGIPKNWRDCHHIHKFPFQVNFDLFTKLFLVVGVCWLFQVFFVSFLNKKILLQKIYLFSSDSCFVGHLSIRIHWQDLHPASGSACFAKSYNNKLIFVHS